LTEQQVHENKSIKDLPTTFIGEAIAQTSHMVTNSGPFRTAYDADVLYRENSKEQVFVCPIIPVFIIHTGQQQLLAMST
jgi:hypothetical protein